MRLLVRNTWAVLAVLAAVFPAPAGAAKVTLGSNLSADATITESNGADTAFWPIAIRGKPVVVPEDGQVLSAKVKGTVLREPGAANPATLIHIQTLEPAKADGSRVAYLASQGFDMPIDKPNAITTFTPENLCVHKGGAVAFNNIGGFMYGGSLSAPLDPDHYHHGAPFQTFGAVASSSTARYTADSATMNGDTLQSNTANQEPGHPVGTVRRGSELLMQVVIATGQDRSEPCGGPRRHADGTLVDTRRPPAMHVIGNQSPYVRRSGQLEPAIYCAGPADCAGTATLVRRRRTLARATFSVKAMASGRIAMRISRRDVNALRRAPGRRLPVRIVLVSPLGRFSRALSIKN
jgi:hypothetical protein